MPQTVSGQRTTDSRRPLSLALLGYGKMGKTIAELAPRHDLQVRLILSSQSNHDGAGVTPENFGNIDVCLDFSAPGAVVDNVRRVADLGCNLVVGTTGWHDRLDEVRQVVERSSIALVYSANFSIGVQLFYQAARAAADVFSRFPSYEPYIIETHHRFKKDAPSGTGLELKKLVQTVLEREIGVSSVRAGYVPGTHELGFDSEADTVILRHTVRSRLGFAEGALHAARWVVGKKGLFTFGDTLIP